MIKGLVMKSVALALVCSGVVGCQNEQKTAAKETPTKVKTVTRQAKTVKKASKDVYVTLSAAGDTTLGKDPKQSYSRTLPAYYDRYGSSYFLKKVAPVFAKDDISIVNFEGTLTNVATPMKKAFTFKGPAKYMDILKKGHIDVASFANNHCKDYGQKSYSDTLKAFKDYQMTYASFEHVGVYKVKGVKLGFISVDFNQAMPFGSMPYAKRLIRDGVKKCKAQKTNAIVVSMHGGIEGTHSLTSLQKDLGHYAINQGASLVLGHHPHVLQGVERYKGAYIAYSLGNFCFGGNTNPKDKETMILQKTFHFKDGKLIKDKQLKMIPCRLSSVTYKNDYQPTIVSGAEKTRIIHHMNSYSKSLGVGFKNDGDVR